MRRDGDTRGTGVEPGMGPDKLVEPSGDRYPGDYPSDGSETND